MRPVPARPGVIHHRTARPGRPDARAHVPLGPMDRIVCDDCAHVLWDGLDEAPARLTAVGAEREPCPKCGGRARRGAITERVAIGMADTVSFRARHHVGVDTLVTGYLVALTRYERASASNTPGDTCFPLFEALNWSVSATDKISDETPGWESTLDADVQYVVAALRCARNVVHHGWDTLMEGVMSGDETSMTWRWLPLGAHALTDRRKPRAGSVEYSARLQGAVVDATLAVLTAALLTQTLDAGEVIRSAERVIDRARWPT